MRKTPKIFLYIGLVAALAVIFFGGVIYKNIHSGQITQAPIIPTTNSEEKTPVVGITEETKDYSVAVQYPIIPANFEGSTSTNEYFKNTYTQRIAEFKNEVKSDTETIPAEDLQDVTSTYTTYSTIETSSKRYISYIVHTESYIKGMAHPSHTIDTFIFDIQEKKLVNVKDLFASGSPYLKTLADLSLADFKAKDAAGTGDDEVSVYKNLFKEGLEPTIANFSHVIPVKDGLMIYFPEYQVAPYAAGAQQVVISYAKLQSIINKGGVLGEYVK